ncbi:aromatic prenyltransferase [Streptomyces broussonetiae]|uniref:Aromatic prenyltransferase n=1 Tax=Streptomyces broussonetiae TaxID=2686304 RepID=A0ABV5EJC1_9ACTN
MSAATDAEKLYTAIEETARLVGAPCSRQKVWPVLDAYREALPGGGVVFSAQAGESHAGELDYGLSVPASVSDPYAHAVERGLIPATDHPAGRLLAQVSDYCQAGEHFADCSVRRGLRKLYAHFPRNLTPVAKLAQLEAMPGAVAENVALFTRHGLDNVVMFGVNYQSRTVSLYFQFTAEGRLSPQTIGALLEDIGLAEPSAGTLAFAHRSFRANVTLSWDSPDIQRIAFAPPPGPGLELSKAPLPVGQELQAFVTSSPRAYDGERMNLFAVKWTRDKEFLEVCSYYQLPPGYEPLRQMTLHQEQV